uniref:Uncharacterized protein n=1 Tax=Anguilla anguilla TaxID=7936 RepID=A0A0E9QEQ4_ANGAN
MYTAEYCLKQLVLQTHGVSSPVPWSLCYTVTPGQLIHRKCSSPHIPFVTVVFCP